MSLKIRRGTDAERLLITPEEGELIYTTDTKELYVGDGETPGGNLTSDNHAGTVTSVTGTGTVAGIALSGTVTTSGNLTLGGTLAVPVANITATGTKDSTTFLRGDGSWAAPVSGSTLPTQTGNSGKVLTTDGTNLSWTTNGNGTVTSVTGTGTVAGISLSGTVNSAGSLTLGGTLAVPVANITATGTKDSTTFLRGDGSWAAPVSGSPLPIQTGNNGKVLTTDGTSLSWITPPMGGTLTSNLVLSTYSITGTNNLSIDSNNGITIGNLNLKSNEISSSDTTIQFGSTQSLSEVSFNLNTSNSSPIVIKTLSTGQDDYSIPKMSFIGYGTTTNISSCTQINPGDFIGGITFSANQTAAQGGDSLVAGALICSIDPNGSVTNGYASGKLIFNTIGGPNFPSDLKSLTFDALGRLAVNQKNATETLDVNGTGKFSGYVIFGSYTTTQRNALTPQNGMVIYNTTANKFQGRQNGSWINLDTGSAG